MPDPAPIRSRIESLRAEIRRHDHLYYAEGRPEIPDAEYDRLFGELETLEAKHPEEVTGDSPTQRVGGRPIEGFTHVRHDPPMLSLEKAKDPQELQLFEARIRKELPGEPIAYVAEPKVDGVSISLQYHDGILALGATRGDGETGDDITHTARTIRSVPLRLSGPPPAFLDVRGEVYMDRAGFERINALLRERGEAPFPNPRNATAGSLKQFDPRVAGERPLHALFYAVARCEGRDFETHLEALAALREWGLPTARATRLCATLEEAVEFAGTLKADEATLPYGMDGVVLKVNSLRHWERLGLKTRHPAYAIAYKPKEWLDQTTTVLRAVTVQVGRTGALTPVAELEPVFLDGSTVGRATLHNFEELARKDLRIGDTVVIEKAGKVIPAVVRALPEKRTGAETPVPVPDRCPACGGPVGSRRIASGREEEVALRCENLQCPAQRTRRLEFFAQRAALELEGLGGIVADRLVERGWVREPLDLFGLAEDRLATLNLGTDAAPRVLGLPIARKILAALAKSRDLPLHRWLYALAIPEIGEVTAYHVGQLHDDLEAVRDSALLRDVVAREDAEARAETVNPRSRKTQPANDAERARREAEWRGLREEIARLDDRLKDLPPGVLGPVAARALLSYFESGPGRETMRRMQELGLRPRKAPKGGGSAEFAGKTVVLTGTIEGLTREAVAALLRAAGATVTGSVTGKTDLVIAGAEPGESKIRRARELGIRIAGPEILPRPAPPAGPRPGELL